MKMDFINHYLKQSIHILNHLNIDEINDLVNELELLQKNRGRLFFLGVGGSAANCSHAVNDFRKLAGIESYAPTDNVSELTARTNDEGWETVFSEWLLTSKLSSKDAIFIFSVGGGDIEKGVSVNIVNAIQLAETRGARILAIVGREQGYARRAAHASIVIPNQDPKLVTPLSESFQAVIWHLLVSHPNLKLNETKW